MEFTILNRRQGSVVVQIDEEDADLLGERWHLAGGMGGVGRYAARVSKLFGAMTTIYLHRVIAQRMGLIPTVIAGTGPRTPLSIDHINGDKLDNRRVNLRLRSRSQQKRNPSDGPRVTNTSGYTGVSFDWSSRGRVKRWQAYATLNGKRKNLGYHHTAEEAMAARRAWDRRTL